MLLLRIASVIYWLWLSVLLLMPDPAAWFGRLPTDITHDVGVHLTAFTVLALLLGLCRFRISPWLMVGGLLIYAVAAESLQAFVPPRTVQWADYAENLLGICLGGILATGFLRWRDRRKSLASDD